ncbi:MAG: hypothetical protein ACJAWS_001070 [Oleiphilaceae bacterium]|jgi:hypothetical protein
MQPLMAHAYIAIANKLKRVDVDLKLDEIIGN